MAERKQVQQYVLEPTTGKAIPVLRGQVLRIKQVGKGQCLDFNAFNLHDYKEFFPLRPDPPHAWAQSDQGRSSLVGAAARPHHVHHPGRYRRARTT